LRTAGQRHGSLKGGSKHIHFNRSIRNRNPPQSRNGLDSRTGSMRRHLRRFRPAWSLTVRDQASKLSQEDSEEPA
jgi:hypothetical protein